jgi:hypothetical protein
MINKATNTSASKMIYNQIALAYTAATRIIIPPRQQLSSSPLLSLSPSVYYYFVMAKEFKYFSSPSLRSILNRTGG